MLILPLHNFNQRAKVSSGENPWKILKMNEKDIIFYSASIINSTLSVNILTTKHLSLELFFPLSCKIKELLKFNQVQFNWLTYKATISFLPGWVILTMQWILFFLRKVWLTSSHTAWVKIKVPLRRKY